MKISSYAEKLLTRQTAPPAPDAGRISPHSARASVGQVATATSECPAALAKFPVRMKLSEAAEYLGISVDAVANLRDLGVIVFINIASPGAARPAWRVDRGSVAAFESSRRTNASK